MLNQPVSGGAGRFALGFLLFVIGVRAPAQMRTVSEPAGKTLTNALHRQVIGQDGKPFHVLLQINQRNAPSSQYDATMEETWLGPNRWVRTVRSHGLEQTTFHDQNGDHFVTAGDYFPLWLRALEIGLFSPVENAAAWTRPGEQIEYKEFPNGVHSTPCIHHEFMLGDADKQVNFANICFDKQKLVEMVQSPEYGIEFSDFAPFDKLSVARILSIHPVSGVDVEGKVVVLEPVSGDGAGVMVVPANATQEDPLRSAEVSTRQMESLAGDAREPQWPAQTPGRGQFTVWVSIDKTGRVREVQTRNTDLSGFAADMAKTLVDRQWHAASMQGHPVQVEGALVYSYPPQPAPAAKP